MDDGHRKLLRQFAPTFEKDLEPGKLIKHLTDVLDTRDEEEILSMPTRVGQVDKLLTMILRRGDKAFSCFLEALEKEQSFLAATLRNAEGMNTYI
jgi:hypothetical protein